MTIDEAITHAREVADENIKESMDTFPSLKSKNCIKCAEEHEQLAEWLEELKSYRASVFSGEMKQAMLREEYNKAIDDFVNVLKEYFVIPHDVRVIEMKAEQLKEGE